jgi:hypothetical protein
MPAARRPLATADESPGRPPLSSWYTQGHADGLGDRLLMFDNQTTGPLELLRVRPDFACAADFETRLRGRLDRLTGFSHPGFAQARAVDHLDNGEGLTVVSAHVEGTRLSEIFPAARKHAGMHVAAARWALGELTASMAALHGQFPGVAHGALAPERIVVTANRHVVITDFIFGDALAGIHLSAERLWQECGVVTLPMRDLVPLDQRCDVVQLALIAISLVRGARVTPEEYGRQRGRLLDEFSAACNREMPVSARALRAWMEEALDPDGFRSAVEANIALSQLINPLQVSARANRNEPTGAPVEREPEALTVAPPTYSEERRISGALNAHQDDEADIARRPVFTMFQWLAAALAIIGVVQGAIIAGLVFRPASTLIASVPATTAPQAAPVDASTAAVDPVAPPLVPTPGAIIASSQTTVSRVPDIVDSPGPQTGGVRVDSPVVLQISEGNQTLGNSPGPIRLAPGDHELVFANRALGVRMNQSVRVVSGRILPLSIIPPDGTLNANAQPWAHLLVDGKPIGDTPLANVALPVGEHELIFRHPQLGERRQRVTVQAGSLTRASASFAQ